MLKSLLITLFLVSPCMALADSEPQCEKVLQADLHFDPHTGKASLLNSPIATAAARTFLSLGRLEKAGAILTADQSADPYFLRLAYAMELSLDTTPKDFDQIPATGALLVASNHPINGVDGVALGAFMSLKRADVKVVLNEALRGVPGMPENAIFIDMTDPRKSFAAVRQMIRHMDSGGALIVFLSGEVSQKNSDGWYVDSKWNNGLISMLDKVKRQKVTMISAFVEGKTDHAYSLARKVWDIPGVSPKVASYFTGIMNIRALARRTGSTVKLSLSSPMRDERLAKIRELYPDADEASQKIADYLRLRSLLQKKLTPAVKWEEKIEQSIADEIPSEIIEAEITQHMRRLNDSDVKEADIEIYIGKGGKNIENVVLELGRLREITFREVGEGSGKARDNDQYDEDYHHMIAWDKKTKKIVGAYRLGYLKEIIEKHGLEGIYSNQFSKYSAEFKKELAKCIELGRSFVLKAYQRKAPLLLLLNGIARVYTEHPEYEYLIGMVSISNIYQDHSKIAMIRFLNQFLRHPERLVQSKNPPSLKSPITEEEWKFLFHIYQINDANSFKELNELVQDIEGTKSISIPPLLKIYPDFGVRFVDFNVDPEFNTTDAFISVHLPTQSPAVLKRIQKMATRP